MSTSRDPTEIVILATIKAHLSAAETALITVDRSDPIIACQAALAELRAATVSHDAYVRGIGHDLRNALTTISGQAQLLERYLDKGTLDPERVRIAVARIEEAVAQTNDIIRRLSDP
jgi:signal transduction histidine kinase